jgi:hypothetical protein
MSLHYGYRPLPKEFIEKNCIMTSKEVAWEKRYFKKINLTNKNKLKDLR